jgi:hypothetical protein
MTQKETILKDLKRKKVSSWEAFSNHGITRLSSIIHTLRNDGHKITTIQDKKKGVTFARYKLEK